MAPNFQDCKITFDEYLGNLKLLAKFSSEFELEFDSDFNAKPIDERIDIGEMMENGELKAIPNLGKTRRFMSQIYEKFIDIYNYILNNHKFDTLVYWDIINVIDRFPKYHLTTEESYNRLLHKSPEVIKDLLRLSITNGATINALLNAITSGDKDAFVAQLEALDHRYISIYLSLPIRYENVLFSPCDENYLQLEGWYEAGIYEQVLEYKKRLVHFTDYISFALDHEKLSKASYNSIQSVMDTALINVGVSDAILDALSTFYDIESICRDIDSKSSDIEIVMSPKQDVIIGLHNIQTNLFKAYYTLLKSAYTLYTINFKPYLCNDEINIVESILAPGYFDSIKYALPPSPPKSNQSNGDNISISKSPSNFDLRDYCAPIRPPKLYYKNLREIACELAGKNGSDVRYLKEGEDIIKFARFFNEGMVGDLDTISDDGYSQPIQWLGHFGTLKYVVYYLYGCANPKLKGDFKFPESLSINIVEAFRFKKMRNGRNGIEEGKIALTSFHQDRHSIIKVKTEEVVRLKNLLSKHLPWLEKKC